MSQSHSPLGDQKHAIDLALFGALGDLNRQALRLRRMLAKRNAKSSESESASPIREGAAPGYRHDYKGEEFEVLHDLHVMAKEEHPPPNV